MLLDRLCARLSSTVTATSGVTGVTVASAAGSTTASSADAADVSSTEEGFGAAADWILARVG